MSKLGDQVKLPPGAAARMKDALLAAAVDEIIAQAPQND
jgi:hypothetical protein